MLTSLLQVGTGSDIYPQGPPLPEPARYTRNRCRQIVLFALTKHKVQMCSSSTCAWPLSSRIEQRERGRVYGVERIRRNLPILRGLCGSVLLSFGRGGCLRISFAKAWEDSPPARSKALLHLSKPWTMRDYEVHHGRRIKASGQQSFVVASLCLVTGQSRASLA